MARCFGTFVSMGASSSAKVAPILCGVILRTAPSKQFLDTPRFLMFWLAKSVGDWEYLRLAPERSQPNTRLKLAAPALNRSQ